MDIGFSGQFTSHYFIGDIRRFKIEDLAGKSYSISGGFSIGIEIGGGYSFAKANNGYIIGKTVHFGFSFPGYSGHIGFGTSNFLPDDFYNF